MDLNMLPYQTFTCAEKRHEFTSMCAYKQTNKLKTKTFNEWKNAAELNQFMYCCITWRFNLILNKYKDSILRNDWGNWFQSLGPSKETLCWVVDNLWCVDEAWFQFLVLMLCSIKYNPFFMAENIYRDIKYLYISSNLSTSYSWNNAFVWAK